MWCAVVTAGVLALLVVMLVPAVRRHLREDADEAGEAFADLTDEQRAEYERLIAENRRHHAEEDAERARAEALMREQDEQEGR
jgi:conjugal transfer/entry exclusion protein